MSLALSTIQKGSSSAPRYILANGQKYWTGHGWSDNESDALLIYDIKDVSELCVTLTAAYNSDVKTQRFTLPLEIDVYGHVDQRAISNWLRKSLRVFVNYKEHDLGVNAVVAANLAKLEEDTP